MIQENSQSPAPELFGLTIQPYTIDSLHGEIRSIIFGPTSQAVEILNVNVHAMNLIFEDPDFLKIMSTTDRIFCDGEGVRQALKHRGFDVPCRITYADWAWQLFKFLETEGFSIGFLGATPEVIKLAEKNVREKFPELKLKFAIDGYGEEKATLQALSQFKVDVLLVGMGMPRQEKWIRRNKSALKVRVLLSGGAVFDYLSGTVSRAPLWMRNSGLEWLYRFLLEPGRMFKRYIIGNPLFAYRVLSKSMPTSK